MMYIYICMSVYISTKCTTPGRDADIKGVNKQTDPFPSVDMLYAFGWFL
jgi:hypothetical protein